jgi:hypothetical protein
MGMCRYCPARALTWWWLPEWNLDRWLCGHHSNEHATAMEGVGWKLIEDERNPARPSLGPVTADMATH